MCLTNHARIWADLAAPFEDWQVRERPGSKGAKLSYITARTAMNRLDDVLGPENWWDRYEETKDGLKCTLTVRLPDGTTVTKEDGGGFADMPEEDNTEKSGYSDAFKRVCVKFGVARYLYKDSVPRFIWEMQQGDAPKAKSAPPTGGAKDERPVEQLVADAAAKMLCPASRVYRDLCKLGMEAGMLSVVSRKDDEITDAVKQLGREWVLKQLKTLVRENLEAAKAGA